MDYFDILLAKKLNGSGGDITIEDLTITANGEYRAPSGKAYGKVTANVPAPSNAIYKQTLSNLPQPIATFTGADAPIDSLKASIEGVQSGSGDPSPSNIRPISGWSSAIITNKDDLTDPTVMRTVTIPFGQTVYGGMLNVSTGELTILYALIDMGDMTWTYQSTNTRFVSSDIQSLSKYPSSNDNPSNIMCSSYANNSYRDYTDKQIAQSNTGNVFVKDSSYTDGTTFKTAMDGIQLVYELATPQTIQLTPTQVRTLLGNNNVFADCGEVTELKYYSETP